MLYVFHSMTYYFWNKIWWKKMELAEVVEFWFVSNLRCPVHISAKEKFNTTNYTFNGAYVLQKNKGILQ
jgi:hypothetical protein